MLLTSRRVAVSTSQPEPKRKSATPASPPLSWRLIRADGRPADVVAFDEAVVSFFLSAADLLGVPKSVAAIYGTCFASPEPLGFTEISARLDISAGSISQGLRVLREVGALKVVTSADDRREYFAPNLEMRKLTAHFIEHRLQRQLDSGRGALRAILKQVPAGNGSAKVLRSRVKSLQSWHDKTRALLPIVRGFLKLT